MLYFLQRGVQTVTSLPLSSFVTMVTIAIALFLLSGFLLLVQNFGRILADAGGTSSVTIYLKEDAPQPKVNDFVRELEANPRIRSLQYVSKPEALDQFRKDLGARASLLDGLEGNNPLPASVELAVQPDDVGVNSTERLVADARGRNDIVDEVVYGNEWVDRMQGILKVFRFFGSVSLLIVLSVVVFLVANTIKLAFYARRDEISIMQLVGASEWFVKTPFILGGVLQGVVGSVVGLTALWIVFLALRAQMGTALFSGLGLPVVAFLHPLSVFSILALGVLLGALGSLFSLGRFMNG